MLAHEGVSFAEAVLTIYCRNYREVFFFRAGPTPTPPWQADETTLNQGTSQHTLAKTQIIDHRVLLFMAGLVAMRLQRCGIAP